MNIGVVITTYNSPVWLEKVLWGYECQEDSDFEIIVADDGSGEKTKKLIESFQKKSSLRVKHVWHEDIGFRKTQILNKAIDESDCDYLIFTDGDCIPRNDFISTHRNKSKEGCYLSAAYYKLSMPISKKIRKEDISSGRVFSQKWLSKNGQPLSIKAFKLMRKFGWFFNFITPAKATWNGANSSAYKSDILSVNGFDERMQYGGLDVEMGERMRNKGIKSIQMRFSTICLHLDHSRGYASEDIWKKNKKIRQDVSDNNATWTHHGIIKKDAS